MTKPSGATASEKPNRRTVSSPKTKRGILDVRVVETPEGPALQFLTAEFKEPPGVIGGRINLEASDEDSELCPKCKGTLETTETHRDGEGDITHWSVVCPNCGITGQVWND